MSIFIRAAGIAAITALSLASASEPLRPGAERGAASTSLTIPVCALNPLTNTTTYFRNAILLRGDTVGGGNSFLAPVTVPDASTITAIRLLVDDISAAQNVTLRFWGASGFNSFNLGTVATTGTPGSTTIQLNLAHNVNNATFAYSVEVAWTTPSPVDQIRIGAIRVDFTPPTAAATCPADVNDDLRVDGRDLSVMLANYGTTCPP